MEMLSARNSRRRRRRSISLADDSEKQIISDHKTVTCENLQQTGALASQSQPQLLEQQRRRRAKSEVNTKRNRIDSSDPLLPEHHKTRTLTRSSNNMLKLPFGSPKRKRTLSEAAEVNNDHINNKQSNNRTISEGSSKDDKNRNDQHGSGKKVTWHRRSASTGSPQPIIHVQHENKTEKCNLLLKVPGLKRNSLTRAKSEDRLHELEADKSERKHSTPEHRRRSATAALEKSEVHWGETPGKSGNEEIDPHHQHGHQRGVAALFARQMLQYSYPLVSPPPIVVEDPPSSDDAGDENKLGPSRRRRNARLNGKCYQRNKK